MNAETLYWFFSTVAQTLVALIALVGIIVVYRIDKLHQSVTNMVNQHTRVILSVLGDEAFDDTYKQLSKLKEWYIANKDKEHVSSINKKTVFNIITTWQNNEDVFARVKKKLREFFLITSGAIFLSVLCIITIEKNSSNVNLVIGIVVLLFSTISIVLAGLFFFELFGTNLITRIRRKTPLDL